ncbi:ParB/RepB/Spo0J family partition protein [Aliiroseovarius sp. S2029]|uniref:ParB/RepB/Spo0J family partition protein n=1 Tax=Aliiroseovarius sp. S2029 TaxID=2936988 RepID=UPI0020BFF076|nr:ParB/RepB/Spo0J family partition protein [Aliiroseovarius sp. S2029]MCK8484328.1 ParB/RepB/Spo0J family partition protein [Aliiroseovarius sp. S2029]
MQNGTYTTIDRNKITTDHSFRLRSGSDSATHLAALRKTLRNTGRLDPVLVWQEADDTGTPTSRLVLLDGHYRLAAYRAEQSAGKIEGRGIPAVMLTGSRVDAHLAALTANSKDTLPLTMQERLNAAWRLVLTYRNGISKPRLARASGVSERTILSMRQQIKKFAEAGETPDGNWLIDRRFPVKGDYEPPSDEARQEMVATLSQALKAALNEVRTHDVEIIGDALQEALGVRQLATIADYLGGGDEEDDRDIGWMEPDIKEGGYIGADNSDADDF